MNIYKPGEIVPITGIYKCIKCKNVKNCDKGEKFPPCSTEGCNHPGYFLISATKI